MCDKDTCNDASCCGECEPWNCLEQQINDALATKEEHLQGYVDEAKDAAAESKASAEASAQSAAESKEFRDEAETAASTAVAAEGNVIGVANDLQDTADKLKQIADELNTAISGIAVSTWYYTAVSDNQTVIPVPADKNEVDIQAIYVEGSRQEPNRGFVFDKLARTITLAEGIPLGLEISIIMGTYSDNPNDFAHTIASSNGAALVGTSSGQTVQETLDDLATTSIDDSRLLVQQPLQGTKLRTQHDKNFEHVTMFDFENIVGDGVTNDSIGLAVIDSLSDSRIIYGLGRTFLVDAVPTSKKYSDGWWLVNGVLIPFDYVSTVRANMDVIALGPNAAKNAIRARNQIAIGEDALRNNRYGRHNLAMGVAALLYLDGATSPSDIAGSRNIAFGGNAGRFMTTGSRNILMGRDVGHNLVDAHMNIIIGNGAVMGDGPNTLDPGVIENQTPLNPSYSVIFGTEAGKWWNAGYGVGIGHNAIMHVKTDVGIVGIGPNAFAAHQSDRSHWGMIQQNFSKSGTYDQSGGKTITVTSAAHGFVTGFKVLLRFTTGANADTTYQDDNWFDIVVVDADTFTIQSPVNALSTGAVSITRASTNTPYTTLTGGCVGVGRDVGNGTSNYRSTGMGDRVGAKGLGVENTGFGYNVWTNYLAGAGCCAFGAYSQQSNNNAGGNTSFGILTMAGNVLTGVSNSAFGPQAMRYVSTGSNNAAFGGNALRGLTTGNYNTAIGPDALRYVFGSTSTDHNYNNCTGIGNQSYCSGDNQVQVGNSTTTVYTYTAVQTRSDERDKCDEVEISYEMASKFLKLMRPLFYRYDYRDDYFDTVETGEFETVETGDFMLVDGEEVPVTREIPVTKRVAVPKDGSRKRVRLHAGLFAQEVKAAMDECGIDFGVFQDHKVNGGGDVLTLAYEQFIPLLIKCQAVVMERMDTFEARLQALEAK